MTTQEAKKILSLYRLGAADAQDAEFADALALARRNPELQRWFEEHSAVQGAIRDRFRQIAVPEGLKEQIISEHKARSVIVWWRQPAVLAAAAVVLLVGIAALWVRPGAGSGEASFATYRQRMISQVLRSYTMTLESTDATEVRAHLARQQAPDDYALPEALEKSALAGCGVLSWRDKRVSMVCFRTGKSLSPGEKSDLFLFVVDRSALRDPPNAGTPEFAQVKKLATASWSVGNKTYVLATPHDEASIREYF